MTQYVKLFTDILDSTVWQESAQTRIVWLTMLVKADFEGNVSASIPGLAKAAGVSLAECEAALDVLSSPDSYSRSPEKEGRRIEPIEGGWHIINYGKYREKGQSRKEYYREWRLRNAQQRNSVAQQNAQQKRCAQHHTDTDTYTSTTYVFHLKNNSLWELPSGKVSEYQKAYPKIDVGAELLKASQWTIDNPPKRKTAKGMPRFLNNWLSKTKPTVKPACPTPPPTDAETAGSEAYKARQRAALGVVNGK